VAAILGDSVVVFIVVVVHMRPRAIPLAMITMRKSIHGFPFLSYMGMGLRLAALWAAGALLLMGSRKVRVRECWKKVKFQHALGTSSSQILLACSRSWFALLMI